MFISLSDALVILEQYRYWLIFPIMILEGPIINVISGFLVYLGILDIYITYVLLVIADLIGDSLHYVVGRYWRTSPFIKKYGPLFGYNQKSEEFLDNHFQKHKIKTFLLAKLSHGMGTAIQMAAGIAKVNFFEYLWVNLAATLPKTLFFLLLGFYMGSSYQKINEYLNTTALVFVGLALLTAVLILSNKLAKKYFAKTDDMEQI